MPLGERIEVVSADQIGKIHALQPCYTRCSLNFHAPEFNIARYNLQNMVLGR